MNITKAKKIMGKNFIGPAELKSIARHLNIVDPFSIGEIPSLSFNQKELEKISKDYILILGIPFNAKKEKLTLNNMRSFLGLDPKMAEPCFYNQDWYLKEKFGADTALEFKWYLIKKDVDKKTRGKAPAEIMRSFSKKEHFPTAILTAFTFFAYYFLSKGKILWKHDFIWCSDKDKNGDRIYTGRYEDPNHINKNGFNIHRHLSIRSCWGAVPQMDMEKL